MKKRKIKVPLNLLECFVDPDECWYDHHGGCQAHGYLSLQPGMVCPQLELKQLLEKYKEKESDEASK